MKKTTLLLTLITLLSSGAVSAQEAGKKNTKPEAGLKHYMPLYLDAPAELNVQKGFREINIGAGFADFKHFNGERVLLEYDFAPVKNLGFEIEVPFVFVHEKKAGSGLTEEHAEVGAVPEEGGGAESGTGLRVGFNYSFARIEEAKTTFAVGYFNEIETSPFKDFGHPVFTANIYNPFFIAAKVWGERFHTMIYTGPAIKHEFESRENITQYRLNTVFSYRFGNGEKETFGGLEINQSFAKDKKPQLILRPQVQIALTEKWKLGLVAGIPAGTSSGLNGSGFFRIIYSPAKK